MTGADVLFLILAIATCGGAVAVVVCQNVVRMAFALIVALASVSGLYFLLNADFVGTAQLMVYVGGTLVLLIFGVMLTATGPYRSLKTPLSDWLVGFVVGLLLLFLVVSTVSAVDWDVVSRTLSGRSRVALQETAGFNHSEEGNTTRPLGLSLLGLRPDKDLKSATGQLSPGYLLPFEIISIHLLVVLIGAAYLARAKRRVDRSVERNS